MKPPSLQLRESEKVMNRQEEDFNQTERPWGAEFPTLEKPRRRSPFDHPAINAALFVLTFFTTTVAGVAWLNKDPFDLTNFRLGLPYSLSLLFILSSHELGHYFASRYHRVDATLPFFIPFPVMEGFLNFGTLGALIRTKSPVPTRRAMFDIGVSGPIAGFIASLAVLVYGFLTLPDISYLYWIHPEYQFMPSLPTGGLTFGGTLLYDGLAHLLRPYISGFVPPMNEMYHYPFLCVGWFGLFVTAMNLLPVGQLDGGHIIYAMFGSAHRIISRAALGGISLIGLLGFLPLVGVEAFGWTGWIFWALVLFFIVKIDHPAIADPVGLDRKRRAIGWVAILMFFLSFSIAPFQLPL